MGKKTAGRLDFPPKQADFNNIPLASLCLKRSGVFFRLHSIDRATGKPWPPLHFSRRGTSRFDPAGGVGSLCVAETLSGAVMELFDDHWGPVGSLGRSVTERTLAETWVSLVSLQEVSLFDATGANLSKLGTDAQLLTGKYSTTRRWAARLMRHPAKIDGILYRSRHDPSLLNVALFNRRPFHPVLSDPGLTGISSKKLIYGAAVLLRDHPRLDATLIKLQVARLP